MNLSTSHRKTQGVQKRQNHSSDGVTTNYSGLLQTREAATHRVMKRSVYIYI